MAVEYSGGGFDRRGGGAPGTLIVCGAVLRLRGENIANPCFLAFCALGPLGVLTESCDHLPVE